MIPDQEVLSVQLSSGWPAHSICLLNFLVDCCLSSGEVTNLCEKFNTQQGGQLTPTNRSDKSLALLKLPTSTMYLKPLKVKNINMIEWYSDYFAARLFKRKQDHLRMNVAPDQTIILGLQIFSDHRSLSLINQKILMT